MQQVSRLIKSIFWTAVLTFEMQVSGEIKPLILAPEVNNVKFLVT